MKTLFTLIAAIAGLAVPPAGAHEKDALLALANKPHLVQHEVVRTTLAADKPSDAKNAAGEMVTTAGAEPKNEAEARRVATDQEAAKALAGANSLNDAREAFKTLSGKAAHRNTVHVATGGTSMSVRTSLTKGVNGFKPREKSRIRITVQRCRSVAF